jgi:HK97 family phage major capsid protein
VGVVVGDFSRGYVIRQVQATTVQRLEELFADRLELGFVGAERVDGTLDDSAALRTLAQPA